MAQMKHLMWLWIPFGLFFACDAPDHAAQFREAQLRMKERCAEAGLKARQDWLARYHGETFSETPEYGYSDQLNTCLYADEYEDAGSIAATVIRAKSRRDRFVLDVFAN